MATQKKSQLDENLESRVKGRVRLCKERGGNESKCSQGNYTGEKNNLIYEQDK